MATSCKTFVGVKRNAERYMFCFPRLRMRSGPESGNPDSVSKRRCPSLTFWPRLRNLHFWPRNAFRALFCTFAPKMPFTRRNALLGPKSLFVPKGVGFHQETIGFISIRAMGAEKCTFVSKMHFGAKVHFWLQSAFWSSFGAFGSKNPLFGAPVGPGRI